MLRFSALATALLILMGCLAIVGASQISYATARAASLKLNYSRPEYAGKGTRTTVIVICGLLTPLWIHFPLMALIYLAVHPNIAMIASLMRLKHHDDDNEETVIRGLKKPSRKCLYYSSIS